MHRSSACLLWLWLLHAVVAGTTTACVDSAYPVVRTIDGDTVVIDVGVLPPPLGTELHLRLLGVDAPELHRPLCDTERVAAVEATLFVRHLLSQTMCEAMQVRLCACTGVRVWPPPGLLMGGQVRGAGSRGHCVQRRTDTQQPATGKQSCKALHRQGFQTTVVLSTSKRKTQWVANTNTVWV